MATDVDAIISAGHPLIHRAAVIAAALIGGWLIARDSRSWPLAWRPRCELLAVVALASMVGSALPALFAGGYVGELAASYVVDTPSLLDGALAEYRLGPKTILGGMLFGFIGASLYKGLSGLRVETSDAFARGSCLMMAIGRLGCIAQHCCFGVVVPAAIGCDFGDGLPRLPVQAIEAVALFGLFLVLQILHRRGALRDRRLFLFFAIYGMIRFVLEFGRETIAVTVLGLGYYQWIALLVAGIGVYQLLKRRPPAAVVMPPAA